MWAPARTRAPQAPPLRRDRALSVDVANTLVLALGLYAGAGLVFALLFIVLGVSRVDPSARGGSWGFRLLILPGSAALWPLLAWRWLRGAPPPAEATAHKRAAGVAWPERTS